MPDHEAVLKYLRMAGEQRIPWRRRPPCFAWLLGWGMIEVRRLPPEGNMKAPALFDMAVLTGAGRCELERLQQLASEAGWQVLARTGYRQDTRTPAACVAGPDGVVARPLIHTHAHTNLR